jgi:hypothetical protein
VPSNAVRESAPQIELRHSYGPPPSHPVTAPPPSSPDPGAEPAPFTARAGDGPTESSPPVVEPSPAPRPPDVAPLAPPGEEENSE